MPTRSGLGCYRFHPTEVNSCFFSGFYQGLLNLQRKIKNDLGLDFYFDLGWETIKWENMMDQVVWRLES
ncbi:hypothetical protein Hdeb2414_s0011g00371231 [Helianthus debilis subsp. tardiflorus]